MDISVCRSSLDAPDLLKMKIANVSNVVRAVETNINCEDGDKDIKAISGQAARLRGALETNIIF